MSNTKHILEEQLDFYKENQDSFVQQYEGKILLIHDKTLVKTFDSKSDAYYYGVEHFEPGTFFIIKCTAGNGEYTTNYRTIYRFSRLAMA